VVEVTGAHVTKSDADPGNGQPHREAMARGFRMNRVVPAAVARPGV